MYRTNSKILLKLYAKNLPTQTAGRSQQIREEIIAITDLQNNSVTFSMINAPREHLRSFLRKRIGYPRPGGTNNFLNVLFGDGKTFLHGSVLYKNMILLSYSFLMEPTLILRKTVERFCTEPQSLTIPYSLKLQFRIAQT
jgi:hypothetical protein